MVFRKKRWILGGLGGVALVTAITCFLWAFYIEPRRLCTTYECVRVPVWAGTEKQIRLAVAGDFHFAPGDGIWAEEIVDAVLAGKPDVVFLLGDYVNGHRLKTSMHPTEIAAHLKRLADHVPVFAVLGNHDAYVGRKLIAEALQAVGINVFTEKAIRKLILSDGTRIVVGGTLDAHSYYPIFDGNDIPKNPLPGETPFILLTHSPDATVFLNDTVDLMLCGHTHGGQICLPGGIPVITSSRLVGRELAAGLHRESANQTAIFVTRGLGTSILPLRFCCPPEIAFIDLVPADSGDDAF